MGVDAYLMTENGDHLWVGRAYRLAEPPPAFSDSYERLQSPEGLLACELEDYGLAMLRATEDELEDGWLARNVVLFARKHPKSVIRLIRDDSTDFATLEACGAFSDDKSFRSSRKENLAVSGICPRCRRQERDTSSPAT